MRVVIKDNADTNCRELWYGEKIQLAVNVKDLKNHENYGHEDNYSLLISFAPWNPGHTHMDTERV